MRVFLFLLLILLAVCGLVVWDRPKVESGKPAEPAERSRTETLEQRTGYNVWTDPTTGCVYYSTGHKMSIRYLRNGQPDCPGTRR